VPLFLFGAMPSPVPTFLVGTGEGTGLSFAIAALYPLSLVVPRPALQATPCASESVWYAHPTSTLSANRTTLKNKKPVPRWRGWPKAGGGLP